MKSSTQNPSRESGGIFGAGEGRLDLWQEGQRNSASYLDIEPVLLFLRRNIVRMSIVSATVSVVAFSACLFLPTKYSATAVLMVDPRSTKVTRSGGVIPNIGGDAIAIESLVQVSHSESFLRELVEELDLTKDQFFGKPSESEAARLATIEKLSAALSIARRGTTYVIDIVATTPSPEKSAKIANAAARKILEGQYALRSGGDATAAQQIEDRLNELRGRVSRAEEAVAQMKSTLNVTDPAQGQTLLDRRAAELNQQLVLANARAAEARARNELFRVGHPKSDNIPQAAQSMALGALRSDLARLSRLSADQSTLLGPRHPDVLSLNAQIMDVKRQISVEIGRITLAARTELFEAEQREADLSRQLRSAQIESAQLGPQMVKLGELEREARAERAVYEELLSRQRELLQVKDLEPNDIRFVSRATPSARPVPGALILTAGSVMLGLLAGLFYGVGREWMRPTFITCPQWGRWETVEDLGFLPIVDGPPKRSAATEVPDLTPWLSDICADLSPIASNGHVLLVSSASRGEGRSTIAVNLAAVFSRCGSRVLLIEADRANHVTSPPHGLLDVLSTTKDLRSAFIEQRTDGYMLLPYGGRIVKSQTAATALMSSVALRAALKLVREWFDVIIIDGPPALEARHARTLAAQADTLVFIVEWDKTDVRDAQEALDRLEAKSAAFLFNKTDSTRLRLYDPRGSLQLETKDPAASSENPTSITKEPNCFQKQSRFP